MRREIKNFSKGFTLIEIVVVMALIAIIASIIGFINLDGYRESFFHSDRDTLVSALQHARAEAVTNVCLGSSCTDGRSQGVAVRPIDNPNSYVIFQSGATVPDYTHRDSSLDIVLEANPNVVTTGSTINEVVFEQISGEVNVPGEIILTDNSTGKTSSIKINSEGQILWTN